MDLVSIDSGVRMYIYKRIDYARTCHRMTIIGIELVDTKLQTIHMHINNLFKDLSQPIFHGMTLSEAPGRACGSKRLQVLKRHKADSHYGNIAYQHNSIHL